MRKCWTNARVNVERNEQNLSLGDRGHAKERRTSGSSTFFISPTINNPTPSWEASGNCRPSLPLRMDAKLKAAAPYASSALAQHKPAGSPHSPHTRVGASGAPHARIPLPAAAGPRAPPPGTRDGAGVAWYAAPPGGVKPMYRPAGAGAGAGAKPDEGESDNNDGRELMMRMRMRMKHRT